MSDDQDRAADLTARMHRMDKIWRTYWCDSKMCGCLGCANRAGGLRDAGYTEEEWRAWINKHNIPERGTKEWGEAFGHL